MKKLNAAVIAILLVLLVGCATPAPPKVQVQIQRVYIEVPRELLVRVTADPPMAVASYLDLSPHAKEIYLSQTVLGLYRSVATCNIQLSAIEQLQKDIKGGRNAGKPVN
jgi:hypothetical protein